MDHLLQVVVGGDNSCAAPKASPTASPIKRSHRPFQQASVSRETHLPSNPSLQSEIETKPL